MNLLLAPFSHFPESFVAFAVAGGVAFLMIVVVLKSALSTERGARWVKRITNPNAKYLFTMLFIVWALVFGIGLQIVPHVGASSPYGAMGLIALFTGFFIMMGFLWSVIGE